MFINKLIQCLRLKRRKKMFVSKTTLLGSNHIFGINSIVSLLDGSSKEDIIISSDSWIHGILHSQNHGKIYFGKCTKIGVNSKILCTNSVYIDDYTAIADNTVICDNNNHPINPDFRLYMRTVHEEITNANLVQSIKELVCDFMTELKYKGFAEFEFMYDTRNGKLWFLEVNTRTCGSQSGMHYKFSNISNILLNPSEYRLLQSTTKPLRWMNIQRDVRARIENNDWKHLGDIFHARYDILDIKDLKPFFRQFI